MLALALARLQETSERVRRDQWRYLNEMIKFGGGACRFVPVKQMHKLFSLQLAQARARSGARAGHVHPAGTAEPAARWRTSEKLLLF